MILREAIYDDAQKIYELSNDKEVRNNSFNKDNIKFEYHLKWYKDKLEDKNCVFLLFEEGEFLIAQVRFDIKEDSAIISISINKQYRGKGLGIDIMNKSIKYFKERYRSINKIQAFIKKTNLRSKDFFEKCNFKFVKELIINKQQAFEYIYEI